MQRLYDTGEYQITDAFLAGADGETMNYTIAVPILKEGAVKGCVFGSIYFDDIEAIMERSLGDSGRHFYLLGRENTLMAGDSDYTLGENFDELTKDSYFFGSSMEEINANLALGKGGSCWQWNGNGLRYVVYAPIPPTEWTMAYQVGFGTIFQSLLPVLLMKCLFYFLLCLTIAVFGRRYLRRHLSAVNHLLDRVTTMQRELFQPEGTEEAPDYENLLELTQRGLTDQLTGLATRGVFFQKAAQIVGSRSQQGTLCFLDLDDLKRINDNFGHEAGDCALLHFAKVLKQCEEKYGGVAARYGGDEFILILPDMDEVAAIKTADQLCVDLNASIGARGTTFAIHGSIGLAHYPRHGETPEELISKADLALYSAKQHGKNCCGCYDGK